MSPTQLYTITRASTSQIGMHYLKEWRSFNPSSGLDRYIILGDLHLGSSQWAYSVPTADTQLERRFNNLARRWKKETIHLSLIQQMVLHPAYQEVIGLGSKAIPLILNELRKEPDFWFWALRALTGEDPTTEKMRGDLEAMTNAWLSWGHKPNA